MDVLETDPDRLSDLPGFPYEQETIEVEEGQMAYVDEGEGEETFLLVHGEPTWGYLYRKMIGPLSEAGRVVVPDLLGFGASSKPEDDADHTYGLHTRSLTQLVEELDLGGVTVVGQDWGGPFGFHVAARQPDRFARIVAANTFLPAGDEPLPQAWHDFHDFVLRTPDVPVGFLVKRGCVSDLPDEVVAAYDAPFPDERYKAGPRRLPQLVPQEPDQPVADPIRETRKRLAAWDKPAYCVFASEDPIMKPAAEAMQELIPTASKQPLDWLEAGHFIQEDAGVELAENILDFVERTPRS